MRKAFAAIMAATMLLGSPAISEPVAGGRSDGEVATLDLSGVVTALLEDRAGLLYMLDELHRRYPDEVEAPDLTGQPALDDETAARLRAVDDERLMSRMDELSGEIDRLVARGTALQHEVEAQAGVGSSRPQAAEAEKPYCYKMYGKAYSLCGTDDRSCKMFAANDYGICKKTGRWP